VETVPEEATVRILNIKPRFFQGMELEPGSYHVEVAAEGYETERRWIDLVAGNEKPFRFELTKIKVAEPISPQKSITNTIGMKFVLIPAGKFVMGSPPDMPGRDDDEKQHEVRISKPFYMQTTEVSQGQWKKVMGNNPSHFIGCGDDCPVERVSWNDAQEFIEKLNQKEKTNKYRLPTEAEWEYACRAGTSTKYSFGDDFNKLDDYAWHSANSEGHTHPVSQKKPNDWGLYDMYGNVQEWCQDGSGDYPSNAVVDPVGPYKHGSRVRRGRAWNDQPWNIHSAERSADIPGRGLKDQGFRVARDF
jgi:formylglycine-generating enzyme required for sulfatase activity